MKKIFYLGLSAFLCAFVQIQAEPLEFSPEDYKIGSLSMPDGSMINYKAYEGIYYVKNIEDSTYQTLNIYVPENIRDDSPIFVRTYVGGYMAATAKTPSVMDATGRALKEGYVVCIPGSRGWNSTIGKNGKDIYTGIAPNALLDLKAAIRYLKYNDDKIPGNSKKIITDGTSAGGAMSSLLGATGNSKRYESRLKKMGTADIDDNVWAAVCYCPITDLDHADSEYEWLYSSTDSGVRHLDAVQTGISFELAALCPEYINSLGLRNTVGDVITSDNYKEYLKSFLIASAQRFVDEGGEIPDSIGFEFYYEKPDLIEGRLGPGPALPRNQGQRAPMMFNKKSDLIIGLDFDKYLSYVASLTPLKTPPAFDRWGVIIESSTPENRVFGDESGTPSNFTDFSLRRHYDNASLDLSKEMEERVYLMNPMNFIGKEESDIAPNWYIRHGAKDRDTSFLVSVNLATKLMNAGYNVDFALPWNRPHEGDYNLDDLFSWLDSL